MQGFIQDFKFGGNLNKIADVENMRKHALTKGSGDMLPREIFKN